MNPVVHAKNSAKKYGGVLEDYMPVHLWMDQTKLHVGDLRHRVILHNSFGIGLCEAALGPLITNSDGKKVSVRAIAEDHVMEDVGFIPSLEQALCHTAITPLIAPRLRKVVFQKEKPT